jgi:putative ABC transport system ATP-binding protein
MLILKHIYVTHQLGSPLARAILQDLNLHAKTGEFILIIGDNGAGKSTLFNLISGVLSPTHGQIYIDQQNITEIPAQQRTAFVAQVMQNPRDGTLEHMTLEENMSLAAQRGKTRGLHWYTNKQRRRFFQDKLAMLDMGLEYCLTQQVGHLSGGQRQALSLMMSTLTHSKILLLDEITAALDPKSADTVMRIANHIAIEENKTTLMITHNMQHTLHYGHRTLQLADGKLHPYSA